MTDILTLILKDTYSQTQLKHRLRLLKTYFVKTFFGDSQNQSFLPNDLNWIKNLPTQFYQQFNKENLYQSMDKIGKQAASLPVITMYLTFEPNEAVLEQIGKYARRLFNPTLLLDIKVNPALIAGTALSYKGVLRDYSLKSKIAGKEVEIMEGFKKFLR